MQPWPARHAMNEWLRITVECPYPTRLLFAGHGTTKGTKMNIETVEKKLREAKHFLNMMRDQEIRAFGDKEPLDHNLSAFLSAGMSFRSGFRVEQDRARNDAIKAWRESWKKGLSPSERQFYDFMHEDRVAEVHKEGSSRNVKT
jgi:hypothetical protein